MLDLAIFPLNIFPPGLSSSVITTVWVGIVVTTFFNLRFGWVLSGLIVPGYIVPLLLTKPISALVIFIEAFVTYAIIWFFSEYLVRFGKWFSFFGRDRFFAILLISVIIRLIFDSWLLPLLGEKLDQWFHWPFDYRSALHSYGLIVI